MTRTLTALFVLGLCACGSGAEIRIGKDQGIPSVTGSQQFDISNYTCGQPIQAQGYTVTTTVKGTDCEFSFDQTVTIIKDTDYNNIPDLKGSSNLVQAIEIEVKKLAFFDATKTPPAALDLNSYVKSASLKINGQEVATKDTLASLPKTVTLSGTALTDIKSKVDARQPATAHATAVLLVPQTPKPPNTVKVDYDAQPTLVLGTGKINLGG